MGILLKCLRGAWESAFSAWSTLTESLLMPGSYFTQKSLEKLRCFKQFCVEISFGISGGGRDLQCQGLLWAPQLVKQSLKKLPNWKPRV